MGGATKRSKERKRNEQFGLDNMILSIEVGVSDKSLGTCVMIRACVLVKKI